MRRPAGPDTGENPAAFTAARFPVFQRPSIAVRTMAFVAAVCLALVGLDIWHSWESRTVLLEQMGVATSNLSRALAQQADDTLKQADTVLVGVVERIEHEGTGPAQVERLRRVLAAQVAELPQLDALHVYDQDGNWVANSRAAPPQNLNNADREYFVFHRDHPDRGPHIGIPVTSRTNGKRLIPVSRRIDHADGSFAGVALASIDVDFFLRFYDSLDIGKGGAAALILESGTMMVRRPFGPEMVGRDMRGSQLFTSYKENGPVGTAYIKSAQDGVLRLNSFRRLDHYPLFVGAALSKDEILAGWWKDTFWHSGGVLALSAVVAFVGLGLVRQIERRTRTEAELLRARDALEALNKTLNTLAMEDGLTGLANRRQFDVALDTEFGRAVRNASTLALILLDVDRFKEYNDIYGHTAGDECLQKICRTIANVAARRPGDLAARYGGEELAVLLPGTDVEAAALLAERIRAAVRALEIEHVGAIDGFVTLSAGVDALRPEAGAVQPKELVRGADKALYVAKSGGRNRVCTNETPVT